MEVKRHNTKARVVCNDEEDGLNDSSFDWGFKMTYQRCIFKELNCLLILSAFLK